MRKNEVEVGKEYVFEPRKGGNAYRCEVLEICDATCIIQYDSLAFDDTVEPGKTDVRKVEVRFGSLSGTWGECETEITRRMERVEAERKRLVKRDAEDREIADFFGLRHVERRRWASDGEIYMQRAAVLETIREVTEELERLRAPKRRTPAKAKSTTGGKP